MYMYLHTQPANELVRLRADNSILSFLHVSVCDQEQGSMAAGELDCKYGDSRASAHPKIPTYVHMLHDMYILAE